MTDERENEAPQPVAQGSAMSVGLGGALEESLIDTLVTKCEALKDERDKYKAVLEQLRDSYRSMHDDPWIYKLCTDALRSFRLRA